jgi:hypothetical protein
MGALRKSLKDIEFVYVNSPHECSQDSSPHPVEENTFRWWNSIKDENEHFTYVGFQESLEHINHINSTLGPFDGLFGFSQGAVFASLLSSLNPNSYKFVILVGGFPSRHFSHQKYYTQNGNITPSLHIIGRTDKLILPEMTFYSP